MMKLRLSTGILYMYQKNCVKIIFLGFVVSFKINSIQGGRDDKREKEKKRLKEDEKEGDKER